MVETIYLLSVKKMNLNKILGKIYYLHISYVTKMVDDGNEKEIYGDGLLQISKGFGLQQIRENIHKSLESTYPDHKWMVPVILNISVLDRKVFERLHGEN